MGEGAVCADAIAATEASTAKRQSVLITYEFPVRWATRMQWKDRPHEASVTPPVHSGGRRALRHSSLAAHIIGRL